MARTHRNRPEWRFFRRPSHLNEEAKLRQLLTDTWLDDIQVSGRNRIHKRLANLPDAWEDLHVSSLFDKHA